MGSNTDRGDGRARGTRARAGHARDAADTSVRSAVEAAAALVEAAREALLLLDHDLRVRAASPSFYRLFDVSPDESEGSLVYELDGGCWDVPALHHLLDEALNEADALDDVAVPHPSTDGAARMLLVNARRLDDPPVLLLAIEDAAEPLDADEASTVDHRQLQVALRAANVTLALCDRALRYVWILHPHPDFDAAAVVGKRDDELARGPGIDALMALKRRVLASGREERREIAFQRSDGLRTYDVTGTPLRDASGRVTHVLTSALDLTERRQNDEALRESERRFRLLADAMPQLVWTAQPDGTVDYYNRRAADYEGLSRREDAHWDWAPVLHAEDRAATEAAWQAAVKTGSPYEIEHRVRMHDGTYRWHLSRAMPVHDTSGRLVRWYGTATDVHGLKEAEAALRESEARVRSFADTAPGLLWATDASGRCTFLSRAWCEYVGLREAEGLGDGWLQTVHPSDVDRIREMFYTANTEAKPFRLTYRLRRHDGAYRWVIDAGRPRTGPRGEHLGYVGSVIDIHDRKRTEEALKRLNETLEERVEERTRQVRTLASTLTLAEQAERRRISRILHDNLQQQLYGVQMKLSFIRHAVEAGEVDDALKNVEEGDAWLRHAVDISRNLTVDLSPPVLQSEGLADALEWLVVQMKELHGLEVTLTAEQPFRTPDEDMRVLLFQIVRELLFNVVKHAGTRRATVELREAGPCVEIHVTDQGQGFDLAASEAAHEGGLGLFSVRERLALFGGSMEIDTAPGEGTRIVVEAPLRL